MVSVVSVMDAVFLMSRGMPQFSQAFLHCWENSIHLDFDMGGMPSVEPCH